MTERQIAEAGNCEIVRYAKPTPLCFEHHAERHRIVKAGDGLDIRHRVERNRQGMPTGSMRRGTRQVDDENVDTPLGKPAAKTVTALCCAQVARHVCSDECNARQPERMQVRGDRLTGRVMREPHLQVKWLITKLPHFCHGHIGPAQQSVRGFVVVTAGYNKGGGRPGQKRLDQICLPCRVVFGCA
ncbi:hypothetical protein R69746_06355 [Paraburkholderia aspalathi]|nr:hypothetical protein R69746_06355 [Paraburkholderia aspalathi]